MLGRRGGCWWYPMIITGLVAPAPPLAPRTFPRPPPSSSPSLESQGHTFLPISCRTRIITGILGSITCHGSYGCRHSLPPAALRKWGPLSSPGPEGETEVQRS